MLPPRVPLLPLEDGGRRRIGGVDRRRDPPLLGRIRPSRGWISESLGSGGRFGAGVPWGRWSARHRELGPGSLGAGLPQLHGVAGEEEMAACYWCSRGGAPRIRLPWPDPTGHGSRVARWPPCPPPKTIQAPPSKVASPACTSRWQIKSHWDVFVMRRSQIAISCVGPIQAAVMATVDA